MSNDPLADLGLDIEQTSASAVEQEQPAAENAAEAPAARAEVNIGELEFGEADFIPTAKRGGPSGSKYEFDKLDAPVAKEDGSGYRYKTFLARLQPGEDADKLKRSVQSAVTAANRSAKDSGAPNRYITRTAVQGGEFVGVTVFRVDGTLDGEDE